jgi:hypothetical protein
VVDIIKSRVDLIERAATELGVKTSNSPLEDEDYQTIDGLVDPLTAQLSLDGVVDIGDTDQVEAEFFLPLAMLLANVSAKSFGQDFSRDVKMEQEAVLRKLTSGKPSYSVAVGDFY